jgi:hypothetical protein
MYRKMYSCDRCGATFTQRTSLKRHKKGPNYCTRGDFIGQSTNISILYFGDYSPKFMEDARKKIIASDLLYTDCLLRKILELTINIKIDGKLNYMYATTNIEHHTGVYKKGERLVKDPRYELLIYHLHRIFDDRIKELFNEEIRNYSIDTADKACSSFTTFSSLSMKNCRIIEHFITHYKTLVELEKDALHS